MKTLDVVVCMCSRGVIHSRTLEAVDQSLENASVRWRRLYTHDKSIPDAQNDIIDRALELRPHLIWMVEEDISPEPDTLLRMLELAAKNQVVTPWYKLNGGQSSVMLDNQNKLLWAGLGCLLINPHVFEVLPKPFFRTDLVYGYDRKDGFYSPRKAQNDGYGRLDVHMFYELQKAGIAASFLDVEVTHWKVESWGTPLSNNGCHTIVPIR